MVKLINAVIRTYVPHLAIFLIVFMPTHGSASEAPTTIVEKPLQLTVHMHHKRYTKYDENWPVEIAACQMTNICLNDATVGSDTSNSGEALSLLLASGNIPDIVGSSRLKDVANQFGPRGAFLPLNDLIDKHAPYIKAFFDERPSIRQSITADDKNIYYIPYLPDGKFARAYWLRTDWLDALNLEVPATVEEFEAVLRAFRNQDPNGNGIKDEIPYFARHWQELIRLVTLFGGRSTGSGEYHDFMIEDDEIQHPYSAEGYRDGIHHLAEWYADGLIDPQIFTRGVSSREELLGNDLGGATHDWFASTSTFNDLSDEIDGFEFRVIAPPANVNGVRLEENRRPPVRSDGWAIGGMNKNPVETIKYFDFWFSPKGRRLVNFGIEGEQYDLINEEAVFRPDFLKKKPVNDGLYELGAQLTARGFFQDYRYEEQWLNEFAKEGIAMYEKGDYLIDDFLGVQFNEKEKTVYNKYWSPIRTFMLGQQKAWILGESDVLEDWDHYLTKLDDMGLGLVLDVMQSAHARQYGD